jgi:signal transduction histidine kinase
MQKEKFEIIISILSASLFVLLIVISSFLLFRIYLRKKNILILEKERMKVQYEQAILYSQLEIQEQTFTQVSEEIHDNIGQVLSLVRLNVNTLGITPSEEKITKTDELLGRAISDLRSLSHNLNTSRISEAGLSESVRDLLQSLQKTGQFTTTFHSAVDDKSMPEEKTIILFRIVQETVNNIIKHAKASAIDIVIEGEMEISKITITDNGAGFDTTLLDNKSSGLGIRNMSSRAAMIDAALHVSSNINRGTVVTIDINTIKNG